MADVFRGGPGSDRLFSGPDQQGDVYAGGPGVDTLDLRFLAKGAVVDLVQGTVDGSGRATIAGVEDIYGTPFPDHLIGDDRPNTLFGGEAIGGFFGPTFPSDPISDRLEGGAGDDVLDGGSGDDTILGGEGSDVINDGLGVDTIAAGSGSDKVSTKFDCPEDCEPPQQAFSGDVIGGGDGNDRLLGGLGDDVIAGGPGSDRIMGGAGRDRLDGHGGSDRLKGGSETDTLDGGEGHDIADFSDARGGVTVDLAAQSVAGASDDLLTAIEGVSGSAFDDSLLGSDVIDTLYGGDGNDVVRGLRGNDSLDGGDGEDELFGGDGDDDISGGVGPRYLGHNQADGRPDLQDGGEGFDSRWRSAFDTLVSCESIIVE